MPRLTKWLLILDAVIFIAATAIEFTPAGPIGRWWEGQPYEFLAPNEYTAAYHLIYCAVLCVMPALHFIALLTKERIHISDRRL